MSSPNPFEFGAATDLTDDQILSYYIPDHNYSRAIDTKRNIFVLGERGSGKSMALLYHQVRLQKRKAETANREFDFSHVGIYIPCISPLLLKADDELLSSDRAQAMSEHYLVFSIVKHLAKSLEEVLPDLDDEGFADRFSIILGIELPHGRSFLDRVALYAEAETTRANDAINEPDDESFYRGSRSFGTVVTPLLDILQRSKVLQRSHFVLMIDDAQLLRPRQVRALNSWISYRDHSRFSFKIATEKVGRPIAITSSGGSILEGHDYEVVDLEKPFHNRQSDYGRFARRVVRERLKLIDVESTPDEFFPISPAVEKQLAEGKRSALAAAKKRMPDADEQQIQDYAYKQHRTFLFRRDPRANLPSYSGFDTITFLSTGVVRTLLIACYWMYDKALSLAADQERADLPIDKVSPTIQHEVIQELSAKTWGSLTTGIDRIVDDCTAAQGQQIHNMIEALARFFRARLQSECSEPLATSFTVSGANTPEGSEVRNLLNLARKGLILYSRIGASKESGSREDYYVPNRYLWPQRGLDPRGQYARVSVRARDLLRAANGDLDALASRVGSDADDKQGEFF